VKEQAVKIELRGYTVSSSVMVKGQIITSGNMAGHNTFDKPDAVTLQEFSGSAISGSTLTVELPPKSVVTVELA
jgi:alpha-N-arabinofuranosidase